MNLNQNKENYSYPKLLKKLSPKRKKISDDFMKIWHEELKKKKFKIIEKFNHNYPAIGIKKYNFKKKINTLEIGAGLGTHLDYENLKYQKYYCLELRKNMIEEIKKKNANVNFVIGDIQKKTKFKDNNFDRIIAIHVLEHLPNLPKAIAEIYRLLKKNGYLQIVIPCDPGFLYRLARKISAEKIYNKNFKGSYDWLIKREHLNHPSEIINLLKQQFDILDIKYFPFIIKSINANLCIGITLQKKIIKKTSFKFNNPNNKKKIIIFNNGTFLDENKKKLKIPDYITSNIKKFNWSYKLTKLHDESNSQNHPIEKYSREICIKELSTNYNSNILEIGCSNGWLTDQLNKKKIINYVGIDIFKDIIKNLSVKYKKYPFLVHDITCNNPFKNKYDFVIALNVLEHIKKDELAIRNIRKLLAKDGKLILEVPSCNFLFDDYDKALFHHRRYNMSKLIKMFKKNGYTIIKKQHIGFLAFLPFALVKIINKIFIKKTNLNKHVSKNIKKSDNIFVRILFYIEKKISFFYFPFGIRCFIVAKKN